MSVYNLVTGLLVLICAFMGSVALVNDRIVIALIYFVVAVWFYRKLENRVLK